MTPEQQANQDMLAALSNQRNAAQNECVQLAAQLMAEQRKVADRDAMLAAKDAEIAALKARVAELEPKPEPQANGAAVVPN